MFWRRQAASRVFYRKSFEKKGGSEMVHRILGKKISENVAQTTPPKVFAHMTARLEIEGRPWITFLFNNSEQYFHQ